MQRCHFGYDWICQSGSELSTLQVIFQQCPPTTIPIFMSICAQCSLSTYKWEHGIFTVSFMYRWESCIFYGCWVEYSIRSNWSGVKFKFIISLLIFFFIYLSNSVSGVLKFLTIIVWLSKSFCGSRSTCVVNLDTLMLDAYLFRIVKSPCWFKQFMWCSSLSFFTVLV